jgi:hypothetical protein
MDRNLSVERTYSLGQYQNIKLYDSISLPEEVVFNIELLGKIRFLQFLQLDIGYRSYVELARNINNLSQDEIMSYLEETKLNTIDEIEQLFKNKGE